MESQAYHRLQAAEGPVYHTFEAASNELLIIFSGKQVGMGKPTFNLGKGTIDWPINKIYVRDVNNLWYHGEHAGIGDGIDDLYVFLRKLVEKVNPDSIVTVGGSMGGYAAILYGCLLRSDKVVSFGPQTFLTVWNRVRHLDHRSVRLKRDLYRTASASPQYYDLSAIIASTRPTPKIDIHIGSGNRIDGKHAKHISGHNNVNVIRHNTKRHDVSRVLKSRGELYDIISREYNFQSINQ